MDMIDLAQGRDEVADSCEHANEHYGCINCMEFLLQLRKYQLLKKDSAKWG
jgi:hypothetical protein